MYCSVKLHTSRLIGKKRFKKLYAAKFNFMPLDFDAAYCYPVWLNMLWNKPD